MSIPGHSGESSNSSSSQSALMNNMTLMKNDDDHDNIKVIKDKERYMHEYHDIEHIIYKDITAPYDIIVEIAKQEFPCHRVVLASRIPYFKAMFTVSCVEKASKKVTLLDIPPWCFKCIHTYIYTGRIILNMQTVRELLSMILFFQMDDLQNICENFIRERLTTANVISFWMFAKHHHFPNLFKGCTEIVSTQFGEVIKTPDFAQLDIEQLEELFNSLTTRVNDEKKFQGIVQWMSADVSKRVPLAHRLLSSVKFHDIPPDELNIVQRNWKKLKISHKWFKMLKDVCKQIIVSSAHHNMKSSNSYNTETEKFTSTPTSLSSSDIYILGGEHNRDCVANVWVYGKGSARDLPEKKMLGSAVVLNQTIITAGGFTKLSWLSSVYGFNLESQVWFRLNSMITQLSVTGCCVINDYMYVCGGFNGSSVVNDVTRYSLVYDLWESYPSMISKREGLGVAAVNGAIYAVGGQTNISIMDTVERYDPRESNWSLQKKMGIRRSAFGIASLDDNLYVCGGFDGMHDLSSLDVYDYRTDRWGSLRPMKYPRRGLQLVPHNGKLWAMGGYVGDSLSTARVECYNPKTDSWSIAENLPTSLFSFSAVVL